MITVLVGNKKFPLDDNELVTIIDEDERCFYISCGAIHTGGGGLRISCDKESLVIDPRSKSSIIIL